MKIAISATDPNLDAQVDPRFGRCQYFIIVDTETMEYESMKNVETTTGGGAGIGAAQLITRTQVIAVLTGNCGPNAFSVLEAAGIHVITGVSGIVHEVIKDYMAGNSDPTTRANVLPHSGIRDN